VTNTSGTLAVPAGTFTAGDWEWQAQTKDARGVAGPWSSSAFFTAGTAPGAATIVVPTPDETVNETALLEWVASDQFAYQWQRVADSSGVEDDATIYADSGEQDEQDPRFTVVPFDTTGRYEWIRLRVRSGAGIWSDWASVRVLVAFVPPGAVTLIVRPGDHGLIYETTTHPGAASTDAVDSFLFGVDADGAGGTFDE
jgi:hypothetical protein